MAMRRIEMTEDWKEIGQGPAYFETNDEACFTVGDEMPSPDTDVYLLLDKQTAPNFSYTGEDKIYAKRRTARASFITILEM